LLDDDVGAAVRGDPRATAAVLETIRPLVVRYCRARMDRSVVDVVDAEDLAQEVCIAILRALPRYQDQGKPFIVFVYGIAAHKIADVYRAAARTRSTPVAEVPDRPCQDPGPEQQVLHGEAAQQINLLLSTLSTRHRQIMLLRIVDGLRATEIATLLGSTAGSIRVAQHRALTTLRTSIAA